MQHRWMRHIDWTLVQCLIISIYASLLGEGTWTPATIVLGSLSLGSGPFHRGFAFGGSVSVVRWLRLLSVNGFLLLALDLDSFLSLKSDVHLWVIVVVFGYHRHMDRHINWLYNKDGLLNHWSTSIRVCICLGQSLEFIRTDDFVSDWSFVVDLLHHVEKCTGFDILSLVVFTIGCWNVDVLSGSRALSAIELALVCFDLNLLPVESGVVQAADCVRPRARLLRLNWALLEFKPDVIWLGSWQMPHVDTVLLVDRIVTSVTFVMSLRPPFKTIVDLRVCTSDLG